MLFITSKIHTHTHILIVKIKPKSLHKSKEYDPLLQAFLTHMQPFSFLFSLQTLLVDSLLSRLVLLHNLSYNTSQSITK